MTQQRTIDAFTAWNDNNTPANLTNLISQLEHEPSALQARIDATESLLTN